MKLAEFNALCCREWDKKDRGGRGDVVSILLTEASRDELAGDAITNPQQVAYALGIDDAENATAADLPPIAEVVNPVTRSVVKIRTKPDGKQESARVRTSWGYRKTWWPATA